MPKRPERNVRPALRNGMVGDPRFWEEPQVPRGGYRYGRHPAHLGTEPVAPSPPALHRPGRGDHGRGEVEVRGGQWKVPVPGKGHVQGVQGKVRGST